MKRKNVSAKRTVTAKTKKLQNLIYAISKDPEYWAVLAEAAPGWNGSEDEDEWYRTAHRLKKMDEETKEKICDGICRYIGADVPVWIDWVDAPDGNVIELMLEVMDKMGLLTVLTME